MEIIIKINADALTEEFMYKIRELFAQKSAEIMVKVSDEFKYLADGSKLNMEIADGETEYLPSDTLIRIHKNKPALKALITLAKELQKSDHTSISVKTSSANYDETGLMLIQPQRSNINLSELCELMTDYPTLKELRKKAWGKN